MTRALQTLGTAGLPLFTLIITIAHPGAAHAQVTSYALVPNLNANTVSVIDTTSHTVVDTIPVAGGPSSLAVTPDGSRAYVVLGNTEQVQAIDVGARATIGSLMSIGGSPLSVTITPDGRKAYVTSQSPPSVSVIDLETHTVAPALTHPDLLLARQIAFTPDGQHGFLTSGTGLFLLDPAIPSIGPRIQLDQLSGLAITPDGQTVYAAGHALGRVVVADAVAGMHVPPPIAIGGSPDEVAFSRNGQFAYVPNTSAINVIDVATKTPTTTVPVAGALGVAFTPDERYAYITVAGGVIVVDAATHTIVGAPIATAGLAVGRSNHFISPPIIVAAGGPLSIAADADLTAMHFGPTYARFHGGTLRLTAPWTTTRHLSLLAGGGTIDTNGFDATVSGDVIRDGTLTKIGAGTLTLSGTSTNTAGTVVAAGTLVVNGTHTAVPLSIAGGTLHGIGTLGAVTATAGAISPGPAAGAAILHAANVTLEAGASLIVDLHGTTAGAEYDRLDVSGAAQINGATLALMPSFVPTTGATFTILTNATGTFAGLPEGASIAAAERHFRITYVGGDGNDVELTVINEPPTISAIVPSARTVPENTPLAPLAFTVGDADGDPATLIVTATSSNQALVPDANLSLGGSGVTRTIAAMPRTATRGETTITLTVSDGLDTATTSFTLTVAEGTYYLAEGATGLFFDTDILLANPNSVAAPIAVTFLKDDGTAIPQTRTLPPMSRTTIRVDEITGLEAAAFSTVVTSTDALPLVVERTVRWDETGYGAHTEKATGGAASSWYFAEGAQGFFSTFFLLVNPHATANTAHVTYFREGAPAIVRDYPLAPGSRTTIDAGLDAALRDQAFGARVTFDLPGVAERAMYFGRDPLWRGGHGAAGTPAPSTSWLLAEGATGEYFTTFVLMANPNAEEASATVTYLPDTGMPVTKSFTIPGGERLTRNIATEDSTLVNVAVATRVESTVPLVVERSQYWGQPAWIDGHNSPGVTEAGLRWGLAEGRVGGADDAQTYILLANPGTAPADVTVTFLRATGPTLVKTFSVAPTSRVNIAVVPGAGSMAPELSDESFGALIESSQPIVVERSLYGNAGDLIWAAGTNATATRLP